MGKQRYGNDKSVINKKDEYIKSLEKEIELLSMNREKTYSSEKEEFSILFKRQEEFLVQNYHEREYLIYENKRLNQEIGRLTRTIELNHLFIGYLENSFWWKLTSPVRSIYRKFKDKELKYEFVTDIVSNKEKKKPIEDKVSVLIFTCNAGEEFSVQLDNLTKQKLIDDIEIVVVDRGSMDSTLEIAKKYEAKIISIKDKDITDSEIYERILPNISGEYIVMIDQNKIVDSKYWIYQAIKPIDDNMAISTVFFSGDISEIRKSFYCQELRSRVTSIAGEQVLFFPQNRNIIQYFSSSILDKSCILIKKKVSNLFLI